MRRVLLTFAFFVLAASPAAAQEDLPPGGTFYDDQGSVHEPAIEGLAASGITSGCHDTKPIFCPDDPVKRDQMAAFLTRALEIPRGESGRFRDIAASIHREPIERLAAAGITKGCNPPTNDRYCPDKPVTRAQMATFLVNALELPPAEEASGFTDIADSVHARDIEALAAAGITRGCNPPDNTRFCPNEPVTRAQMASFLVRALGIDPIEPPPLPEIQRVSRFTTYHDCCEPRVHNIHLIARTLDGYVVYPGETFSINKVVGPRTRAKGYVAAPVLCSGANCEGIGGGISQFATTMFNAIFWGGYDEVTHRPHSIWIDRYPRGIEATLGYPSLDVAFRNDTVTPVTIRTRYTDTSITVELWGNAGGWQVSGYHPRGATKSVIEVIDDGGADGRKVSGKATGYPFVRIERTITQNGKSETERWTWSYRN